MPGREALEAAIALAVELGLEDKPTKNYAQTEPQSRGLKKSPPPNHTCFSLLLMTFVRPWDWGGLGVDPRLPSYCIAVLPWLSVSPKSFYLHE
eukprot:4952944-Amphidinium_carterae.1